MPDKLTREQRHRCMASIRGRDTKPEMTVRRWLHSRGFRYRVNVKRLPGTPDIVLRKYRTVIFIHGCFWHGHEGCRYFVMPKSNTEFWTAKIQRNHERDEERRQELKRMGWHTIVIWECQLKPKVRLQTLAELEHLLYKTYLDNLRPRKAAIYDTEVHGTAIAAEEATAYESTMRQTERIRHMEELYDLASEAMKKLPMDADTCTKVREAMTVLAAYYASKEWKQDFADDEAELLPKDLKRGVLSEDGLWNLLADWHSNGNDNGNPEKL